jgi:K+-sensing histidine kinase KdpD/DNA-binding response OmpR family regulator
MSKKRLHNRLESLFSNLAGEGPLPPEQGSLGQEIPADGNQPVLDESSSPQAIQAAAMPTVMTAPALTTPTQLVGWSWEIDSNYNYVFCGLEISDALRMNAQNFIGKSIFSYGLHPKSKDALEAALKEGVTPFELVVYFENTTGAQLPIRLHILSSKKEGNQIVGWKGFAQRLPEETSSIGETTVSGSSHPDKILTIPKAPEKEKPAHKKAAPSATRRTPPTPDISLPHTHSRQGIAIEQGDLHPASQLWTETGKNSLEKSELLLANASAKTPAAMAIPFQMQGVGDLILEIVDDAKDREWTEDDRFLVMEIAAQLALALDNAQLYISVQQELAERIRAEQAILRRNKDLAALNQIGQQLSRLATRTEIFELLSTMIGEVLDNQNLYICSYISNKASLSFPVFRRDGQPVQVPDQPFGNGIPEYVIHSRTPLLVKGNAREALVHAGIDLPERLPLSLLAIPMIAGERSLGAIVVQDFLHENAFDTIQSELLSTAASQATTALENAELFQQMQNALNAIENRERYQANVARSAAILTEFGTQSMPEVLKVLGQAAQCSRVYFAMLQEDERGLYWTATAEWIDPAVAYLFDKTRMLHIPVIPYLNWSQNLREKGWFVTQSTDDTPESEFIEAQHIRSTLLLSVPGSATTPSFVAFDQLGTTRTWQNEEINVLRVAADAISNTFVREGLLEQLQVNLDETEGLYKASNRLALANDMQEMVSAVLSGVRTGEINRAVLLLFEYDTYNKVNQIVVGANWYSGRGTPPPPVGTEYLRAKYERLFQTNTPVFFDDILEGQIEKELQDTLVHQNIRALAILPLWSGKRQIGVLLLQSETKHRFTGRETRTYPPLVDQMAISVENQRLFVQTQKALSETELLYNVSNRIAQAADTQDMLTLVVETVMPSGADRASLILIESDANGELVDLELVGVLDVKGEYQRMGLHMPISALPLVKSLTDEPLIITDINQHSLDTTSRKTLEQFRIVANCMVPLRSGGRLTGLLNASARFPTEFSQEDTRLLRVVGNGIAVALEKQRLLRQAQRRALELQTASEIARDTASTLSLDLLLNRIVNMLSERFGFYYAALFLLDESSTYGVIREATGEAGQEMKQRGHKLAVGSRSVVGAVTATGEPFILNDVHHNSMHFVNPLLPDTRSEMGVPLKLGSTVIGALDLQSKEVNAFNQDDVTVLQILSDQIAIAIENARAYELSQKAIADMKEIDRVKSQFLANMSHELRTPLNSIIGFSRVILKGIDGSINDTQKTDLTAIYNSGQHLLSLINDILDLSKIDAGKMELAFSDVNLADLVNSAMSTAVGLVKDKPIKLHTVIPENLPLVKADSTRVRQVLINFLSNAAKFTDQGSITVDASVVDSPKGKPEVMVTVTDSGPGIAQGDQGKLFLPFSQVDDSPTRKTGGTGLGLSICRSLIEMHGGRIGLLRSEIDKGSTFFFTLLTSTPEIEEPQEPSPNLSNTILAIDDDSKVINLYERYLKPHGYQVVPLTESKRVVERVKEVKPFAITLDIMMPEKDGWDVIRELKNDPETREIPIIICSILESQEKGFSLGASDYLVKPFLQEDMISSLNRLNRDGQIKDVLVIDDDPGDLRLVQKMLEEGQRYQVTLAQGGKQGWEMIQSTHPDAIIMDLFMPDFNGFNILENLRANPVLRHIPVIILTGADLTAEQHQQLTDFGQGVLAKGYLREKELLVLLEEALRKFHPASMEE